MQEDLTENIRRIVREVLGKSAMGDSNDINTDKVESQEAHRDSKMKMEHLHKVEKPEHMTHLRGEELVYKDHPRIVLRGAIDSLESEIILVQILAEQKNLKKLTEDLEEVIKTIRLLLRCEVSNEPVGKVVLQGLDTDELRAHSHHPSQYYGMRHFLPTSRHGEVVAQLNHLRTKAREVELTAYRAFKLESGDVEREDIIRVFNRLSSLFWIMMFKYLTGVYE